jgi:uroporphyrinogen decarboxylase
MRRLEWFLGAVGPYIDIILFSDDYGMQTGPQISGKMFRRFFKPRQQEMWSAVKRLGPVKLLLHSCGGIRPLLPDMIEAGLDAINPVQISAAGMEPEVLKAELGGRIVWWGGGCDTQRVLPNAAPAEVREHVQPGHLGPRRWVRLSTSAQHPGQRSARKHRSHVRRHCGVERSALYVIL